MGAGREGVCGDMSARASRKRRAVGSVGEAFEAHADETAITKEAGAEAAAGPRGGRLNSAAAAAARVAVGEDGDDDGTIYLCVLCFELLIIRSRAPHGRARRGWRRGWLGWRRARAAKWE